MLQVDEIINVQGSIVYAGREEEGEANPVKPNSNAPGNKANPPRAQNNNWRRPRSRTLKLSMTDVRPIMNIPFINSTVGLPTDFWVRTQDINGLFPDTPPGVKIKVKDVTVRRGMLLLSSDTVQIVGGAVDALIAARNAARVNGKRKRRSLSSLLFSLLSLSSPSPSPSLRFHPQTTPPHMLQRHLSLQPLQNWYHPRFLPPVNNNLFHSQE